ncbi:hypothetical protein Btru_008824 [Bulinus truncatus]|nr:hypothetical protein Btru_008824 [Bulinus truncatus]
MTEQVHSRLAERQLYVERGNFPRLFLAMMTLKTSQRAKSFSVTRFSTNSTYCVSAHIMGRRAGVHNSPIECVMEKYHSNIGTRLSGVFNAQTASELSEDFCQLTLDSRHRSSVKVKHTDGTPQARKPEAVTSSSHKSSSSGVSTSSSSHSSEHEPGAKDKTRLVDKLTRALFQKKKHMCARCQRRSRSCLPNKNFTHREKHYTCAACRQQSHVVKHLFGQSSTLSSSQSLHKHSSSHSKGSPEMAVQTSERPQHRTQNTDSGYDTVTSCSTVSSACSASTMNTGSRPPQQFNTDCHTYTTTDVTAGYYNPQFRGVVEDGPLPHTPAPKESRYIQSYDGYLPDIDFERLQKCQLPHSDTVRVATPLQDATNFEGRIFHSDNVSETPLKSCYTCSATDKPCFKLPWEGGWLCEDCLDVVH